MQWGLVGRRLGALEPERIAAVIDIIYRSGRHSRGGRLFQMLMVDHEGLRNALGERLCRRVYLASLEMGLGRVSRLFTDLPPRRSGFAGYDKEEEAGMELLSLGLRRSMAKSPVKDTLDRLLSDPDPVVIRHLLDNPRITEREVLKIASKRPNSPEILRLVAGHRKWSKRRAVKKSVALNPYAPPRLVIGLLEMLLLQDLKEIATTRTLHRQIRLCAQELIAEREGAPPAGETF
ncbi:MAG TPA: hypothetical protein ENJ37_08515 [Deltaproteobacteria bacterium]|nr:hypothetical protein [Deltaproteobacteria bacterium]